MVEETLTWCCLSWSLRAKFVALCRHSRGGGRGCDQWRRPRPWNTWTPLSLPYLLFLWDLRFQSEISQRRPPFLHLQCPYSSFIGDKGSSVKNIIVTVYVLAKQRSHRTQICEISSLGFSWNSLDPLTIIDSID